MDMNNVKSIYDNSVGKEVKKIQDANGNVIWQKNLFLGFDSPWCCDFSAVIATGVMASLSTESQPRETYFFACKPNTTYRYTATTAGDRFNVYSIKQLFDYPPEFAVNLYPYRVSASDIRIIENRNIPQVQSTKDYTFTTGPDDKMVYVYLALNTRPTGVRIVEI